MLRSSFYNGQFKLNTGRMIGGDSHITTVNTVESTRSEYRIARTDKFLFNGRITNIILCSQEEVDYLFAFFTARRASQQGFKFRNNSDYRMSARREGVPEDLTTWTIGGVMEPDGIDVTQITPAKIYASGGYIAKKQIFFADGVARLFKDGIYQQDLIINQFGVAPYIGNTSGLSIEMKFFLPIWFDSDALPSVMLDRGKYKISDIPIRERLYTPSEKPSIYLALDPSRIGDDDSFVYAGLDTSLISKTDSGASIFTTLSPNIL